MKAPGRHYVTLGTHRWRNFLVVRQDLVTIGRNRVKTRYTTVSRHWTWKGANKVAHRLNGEAGTTG